MKGGGCRRGSTRMFSNFLPRRNEDARTRANEEIEKTSLQVGVFASLVSKANDFTKPTDASRRLTSLVGIADDFIKSIIEKTEKSLVADLRFF